MTPDELNGMVDDALWSYMDESLKSVAMQPTPTGRPPPASFLTLKLLQRVHDRVVHLIRLGECSLSKHKALARATMLLTGVKEPPDLRDVESIGNRVDRFLTRQYKEKVRDIMKQRKSPNRDQCLHVLDACCCQLLPHTPFVQLIQLSSIAAPSFNSSVVPRVPFVQPLGVASEKTAIEVLSELVCIKQQVNDAERETRRCAEMRMQYHYEVASKRDVERKAREDAMRQSDAMDTTLKRIRDTFAQERALLESTREKACRAAAERERCLIAERAKRERIEEHIERELVERLRKQEPKFREELQSEYEERLHQMAEARKKESEYKCRAQKRARNAEKRAVFSGRRLERAQAAEAQLVEVKHLLDERQEVIEQLMPLAERGKALDNIQRDVIATSEHGRVAAYPWKLRKLLYGWLSRRTPPSVIGPNLVDAAALLAPGLPIEVPSKDLLHQMRQEVTLAGEALAAYRIAGCKRIISFGFDETTKMGEGLASASFQIELDNGESCDEVLRGAFLIPGGKAHQVASAVESKLFSRGRKLLQAWKDKYESMFGALSWPGPKPSQLGYHQLVKALIMSDTCNAARAAKRCIIEMAGQDLERMVDPVEWAGMSEVQKAEAKVAYVGDCMQHLRNILLDSMASGAVVMLREELQQSLEAFSSYERMSTDIMQLIRAVYKEFHHEGEYAKGKGKEFTYWLRQHHGASFFLPFERAAGGRQDLAFDGAVPIFANFAICTSYLRDLVFTPGHKNILEDFLWHTLSCVEMLALCRVLTLWNLLLSRPFRWLCGCSSKLHDWSVYSMGSVLDKVESFLTIVSNDGAALFDPTIDVFSDIAAAQPAFKQWRDRVAAETICGPDGKTKHRWYELVLNEARHSTNESIMQTQDMTVQLAQAMAVCGLTKMRDPKVAIADWLTSQDGKFSLPRSAAAHEATKGAHVTNDRVESNFGSFDNVIRVFRTISVDAASGIAQAMRMHYFDPTVVKHKKNIAHCRKPQKDQGDVVSRSSEGYFGNMPEPLQRSCIEMARSTCRAARNWERSDRMEQLAYRELMRAQNLELQIEGLVEKGAIAVERFNAYGSRAAKTLLEACMALERIETISGRAAYLREQIELRVLGFGWTDFAVTWKKGDEDLNSSITRLTSHLKALLIEEKARAARGEIPSEPWIPDFEAKSLKNLGQPTADSLALAKKALCSPEMLAESIRKEKERRLENGFADDVQAVQPLTPPPLDEKLVGVRLEVCWHYTSTEDNKTKIPMWCSATVVKVADGQTDKGADGKEFSTRARALAPRGMVLLEWEADLDRGEEATQCWYLLNPSKWNKDAAHRGWRLHPEELAKRRHQQRR